MTRLTEHFTLEELTRSEAADRLGIENTPTPEHLSNLRATARGLEKIRSACGDRAIRITSGYRNPEVNKAVGGVAKSAHALGLAADIMVMGLTPTRAAAMITLAACEFDQLIHETSRGVLHISFDPRARGQCLTQSGPAGSPFTKGIELS
jgi:putative chitinase